MKMDGARMLLLNEKAMYLAFIARAQRRLFAYRRNSFAVMMSNIVY